MSTREPWYRLYEIVCARTGFSWHAMAGHTCNCVGDPPVSLVRCVAHEVKQ